MSGRPEPVAAGIGRSTRAELVFAAGGGRTVLVGQKVPYPFHVTRTFNLQRARPDVATLYLQSSSGGLYRGDDLTLDIAVRAAALACVTTQAATMVHATGGAPARQTTHLRVAAGALLAYTPDPLVLFPGASLTSETRVILEPGARALVVDGLAWHDLGGIASPFDLFRASLTVVDPEDRVLMMERGTLTGSAFLGEASPLGSYRALGTTYILGPAHAPLDALALQAACDAVGCLVGISDLPSGLGSMVRCLAPDGGSLRRGLHTLFAPAFTALTGFEPPTLRK